MDVSAIAMNSVRPAQAFSAPKGGGDAAADAKELREAYTQFVGETFYGTLLKSMRATVGEPAYFHGGTAEEMFQGRLDQQLATDLAPSGGRDLASKLFESQFPNEAALLREAERGGGSEGLAGLDALRRR